MKKDFMISICLREKAIDCLDSCHKMEDIIDISDEDWGNGERIFNELIRDIVKIAYSFREKEKYIGGKLFHDKKYLKLHYVFKRKGYGCFPLSLKQTLKYYVHNLTRLLTEFLITLTNTDIIYSGEMVDKDILRKIEIMADLFCGLGYDHSEAVRNDFYY